jgi:hypothetical protein
MRATLMDSRRTGSRGTHPRAPAPARRWTFVSARRAGSRDEAVCGANCITTDRRAWIACSVPYSRSGVGRGGLSRCHKISPGGVTNAWKTARLPEDFRASSEDSRPVVHAYNFAGCAPFLTRLGCRCFHVDEFCKRRPEPWRRHPRAGQRLKSIHLVRSGW